MAAYAAYRHIELDKVGAGKKRTNKKNDSATSSSDSESDADYVPSTKELKDEANRSADEESDGSESPAEAADHGTGKRKKRNSARKKKKTKITDEPEETEKEADVEPPKNVDDIWNEFKKDVDSKQPQISKIKTTDQSDPIEPEPEPEKPKTKTVTELFEFAGEAVQVEKEVPVDTPPPKPVPTTSAPRRGGGMASILGQIGKKNKLSVLEKSKLDWNNFKKQEGIEEDLQVHNKGKDGFLERQDFLQRTDLRQFEIEKAMRSTSRRK